MRHYYVLLAFLLIVTACNAQKKENTIGQFHGTLRLIAMPDGRKMKLEENFGYTDWKDHTLTAPVGFESDGASIPKKAWSFVGGPWEGKYRLAAVVHDWGCVSHELTWQETHKLFFDAMLDAGEEKYIAQTFYAAVYEKGPRWTKISTEKGADENELTSRVDNIIKTAPKADRGNLFRGNPYELGDQALSNDKVPREVVYGIDVFRVTPTSDVNLSALRKFMREARSRQVQGNPLSLEEVRQKADQILK